VIPEQVRAALKLQKGDLLEIDVIKFQSSNIGDDAGNHKPAPLCDMCEDRNRKNRGRCENCYNNDEVKK